MAKKQNKSSARTKHPWGKYALVVILLIVIVLPVAYVGYQKYLDKVDADRFATLQSDFKKLQVEFNKIDPGWEYSEGCTAGGKLDDFKTCSISLANQSIKNSDSLAANVKKYHRLFGGFTTKVDQQSYTADNNLPAVVIQLEGHKDLKNILCDLSVSGDTHVKQSYVYCRDSARDFYFNRTDR